MTPSRPIRVLFALAGLHRVRRGAEIAFESVAAHLACIDGFQVTLIGSGQPRANDPYRFIHAPCRPRERFERWPRLPLFRDHYVYEEASFLPGLWRAFRPADFDATITCSYPFTNWLLRAPRPAPRHLFVTQNGDWPARERRREYRFFGCDDLICTNPEYVAANRDRWRCTLIPNGVDPDRFAAATPDRAALDLPQHAPVAIIVAALIPSKRVLEGIRAVATIPDLHLLVVGDGELRAQADSLGHELLGQRYRRTTLPFEHMPMAYASADLLIHLSTDEPFGNVYVEALAAGLPVVAHDRPTTRWMLGDGNRLAVLADTNDAAAAASAVRAALTLRSPALARERRDWVASRFAWSTIARQYADLLSTGRARAPAA
ncbi:MAG: glycosyltransferase family 4 protein [Phycisphaerales bacterium]